MKDLQTLAQQLIAISNDHTHDIRFDLTPIPGEVDVLQIEVENREELPIFLSSSAEQILCISYLFNAAELKPDMQTKAHEAMLLANISMPLSAFAKIDDQYVVYGALSINSSLNDIVHELDILSSNAIDAIDAMQDYLQ